MSVNKLDQWATWLMHRRDGDDPANIQASLDFLIPIRDRVLENADLKTRDVLLDIGTGTGLIAFGALKSIGEDGKVVFCDISEDLLEYCRDFAVEVDELERCDFIKASADDLADIGDQTVDVVTTRSVLIYVDDKPRAFKEFYRVLKAKGRLSIFEPINRFAYPEADNQFWGYGVSAIIEIAAKVRQVYVRPETAPMINFDERDLIQFALQAGFKDVRLEYEATVRRLVPKSWEDFLANTPNPLVPPFGEALLQVLSSKEREQFEAVMRPKVESGQGIERQAMAYVVAKKTDDMPESQ